MLFPFLNVDKCCVTNSLLTVVCLFSSVCRGNAKALFRFLLKSPERGDEQPGPNSGRRNERRNERHRGEKLKKDRLRNSPTKRLQVNSKVRRVLRVRLKMTRMMERKAPPNPRRARASEKRFVSFVVFTFSVV